MTGNNVHLLYQSVIAMETTSIQQIYIGLFKDRNSIEHAYNSIYGKGYNGKNVNLIMLKTVRDKYFNNDTIDKRPIGLGSQVSFVNGILDVIKFGLIIPAHSLFVAGPISAGLSGAGAGGFSSGVIASLLGIPDLHAKKFESGISDGHIVMSMQPLNEEEAQHLEKIWQESNVEEVYKK